VKPHLYFRGGRWHVALRRRVPSYKSRLGPPRLPFEGYSSFRAACEAARWRWDLREERRRNPTLTG